MLSTLNERSFDSYDVRNRSSFAPFVYGRTSGIYIFEFTNGQYYVGQTRNFARRFPAHLRDSSHHPPWNDISRLLVMDADPADLDALEAYLIEGYKNQGHSLRNKVFNFGFEGPSRLDVEVHRQRPINDSRLSVFQCHNEPPRLVKHLSKIRGSKPLRNRKIAT